MNIAYLEDDFTQQEMLKGIAEDLGHRMTCFEKLDDFYAAVENESFQLIFLDNLLENDIDSFEHLSKIRSLVGPSVGIVGLTGSKVFAELRVTYEDLGLMNHLLFKPAWKDDIESAMFFIGGEED